METLKFKTNINCGGCVAKVTPALNSDEKITEWHVDTDNKDKILTVSGKTVDKEKVMELIAKTGFKSTPID
ncbi:heavy-metal-associated domain-containing protein [Olivibacter sitiensis]|uniref:heavy-metal-associated domain-containing protein n=1 Tax=Olivibacter sitiensis TaxID=376470 RepID=UPI0003FD0094|nr:heavy-metal-associated domain-containing protein [Olivibacter sitiensis]